MIKNINKRFSDIPELVINKWQGIADLLASIIGVPAALIMKTNDEYMEVFITSKTKKNPYRKGDKEKWFGLYCETVIKTQKELLVPNALKDENWNKNPDIKLGMISYLGIPINFPDNTPFGTICVLDNKENKYSNNYKQLLIHFKDIIENDLISLHNFNIKTKDLNKTISEQNKNLIKLNRKLIITNTELQKHQDNLKDIVHSKTIQLEKEIIDREKAEDNIKKSFSLLTATLESTADGILVVGKSGKITSYNNKFIELWQISDSIISTNDDHKIISVITDQLKDPKDFLSKTKELYSSDLTTLDLLEFKDGRIFERYSQPHLLDGIIIGRVWSFRDVTESKKAEQALKESEFFFKESQRAAFIGSYKTDFVKGIWESSEVLDDIFGIDSKYERTVKNWTNLIHPDDRELMYNYLTEEVIGNRKAFNKEYRVIRKTDAAIRWVKGSGILGFDNEDNIISLIGTIQDITERKISEQELIKSETLLRELNTTKDKLLSIIAHDLHSPFNSILGFSDILIETGKDLTQTKTKMYLGYIKSSAKNTLILLNNLLNWAKSQSNQISFKPQKLQLSSIIHEVIELSNSIAKSKNITINYNSSNNINIYADKNMLETILRNLISNAIKFTPTKGKVDIYATENKNNIEITVSDNGVGINQKSKKSIFQFETNTTTAGTENEKGSGLGLTLCKDFVEKHNGNIWVKSEFGKGSDFVFTLPLNKMENIKS
jgi:PAS domain S-box-containing protein